jgi:1-pyrroline-5-carboxylate dehydrogenase
MREFKNEPLVDFNDPVNAQKMQQALETVRGQLGRTYPIVIGGKEHKDGPTFDSINPANPQQVVGRFPKATVEQANQAIEAASKAFESWSKITPNKRAEYLFKISDLMRQRKFELEAWLVFEVSKTWPEADADVAELIDFIDYYGVQMLKMAGPQPVVPYPGEKNELRYIPLGVGVVIPPWNFPAAIMGGMTAAAIVAGNTVVLKPASTSPTIAAVFMGLVREAGVPDGVVNFVPGPGGAIGDALVDHPKTRFIAFTGSKDVGLRIYERAAKVQPGQIWLKRTVLEMGGKDSIVVDETADLDSAAEGIVAAAFGFQGQKCSACSRAIVVEKVYDQVLQKAVDRAKQLKIGDPTQQSTFMGAVIDQKAFNKINEYIELGAKEGRLVLGGAGKDAEKGYFVSPTIIADVKPEAKISLEEIFGPVLAFIKAKDYDDALRIANNTEYGLTGAVYSKDEQRLERAREDFHVGNLYLNRKCTGAIVGVHPFGGFNMSGTDSKAGGPDYLLQFTQAKTIARKVTA